MKYQNIREEELKNKIAQDYFWLYDCTKIIGNVDFSVCMHRSDAPIFEQESIVWAEAKKGVADIYKSIVQLILTIGKARTFDKHLPPAFLAAFDAEKMAFIPYNEVQEVFYQNDFNWNVAPSNHETKEFKQIFEKVKTTIETKALLFNYENDDKELKKFIKENIVIGRFGLTKTRIDKNNFITIYNKWLQTVKPTIVANWQVAEKNGIIDGDFYLADLLSEENITLKEKLFVLLKNDHYVLDRKLNELGLFNQSSTSFTDNQKAHTQFWNKYERPPKTEYWDYIVERRDLLVPQDVRERKGSFFTPQIWVELSQQYLAKTLGENWQDEYYIWDCAAGTGNLLHGLTNKYNVFASTLDKQDVDVIHDRIENGANLLEKHVFQFDFLNDDFSKLPKTLHDIIKDPKKREKLVIYINPPYAEATSATTVTGTGQNKAGVTKGTKMREAYQSQINGAANEIFALFMARIYTEIPNAKLAQFSKLKFAQGSNFTKFREFFKAKFLTGFIIRANTFDNVVGNFPIGFTVWDTSQKEKITQIVCDIIENKGKKSGEKTFYSELPPSINKWIKLFDNGSNEHLAYMENPAPDFQNNKFLNIETQKGTRHVNYFSFTKNNIYHGCIYFTVRQVIQQNWLNDRDQFLYPNDGWKTDTEFQNDCLIFTLFYSQNRISAKNGTNHWIPFTEYEINAKEKFESNFMSQFIRGKIKPEATDLFAVSEPEAAYSNAEPKFSAEATAVFEAGKTLWKYYHGQPNCNVNAAFYDIRAHFQGRNEKGNMNNKSTDETYTNLLNALRDTLKILAEKIEPKVYEYRFLK